MTSIKLRRARYTTSQMPGGLTSLVLADGEPIVLNDEQCYVGDGVHPLAQLEPIARPSAHLSSAWNLSTVTGSDADSKVYPITLRGKSLSSTDRVTSFHRDLCAIVDPVSGDTLYGTVEVTEQAYPTNGLTIFVEQVLTAKMKGGPTDRKVFRRQGYTVDNAVAVLDRPETWSLTWQHWYPVEYPYTTVPISASSSNPKSVGCVVCGGIAFIRFESFIVDGSTGSSPTQIDIGALNLSFLGVNKFVRASRSSGCVWSRVFSTDGKEAMVGFVPSHLYIWNATGTVRYYGKIEIPLGY